MESLKWPRLIPVLLIAAALIAFDANYLLSRYAPIPIVVGLAAGMIVGAFMLHCVCLTYSYLFASAPAPELSMSKAVLVVASVSVVRLAVEATVPLVADGLNMRVKHAH